MQGKLVLTGRTCFDPDNLHSGLLQSGHESIDCRVVGKTESGNGSDRHRAANQQHKSLYFQASTQFAEPFCRKDPPNQSREVHIKQRSRGHMLTVTTSTYSRRRRSEEIFYLYCLKA